LLDDELPPLLELDGLLNVLPPLEPHAAAIMLTATELAATYDDLERKG
jgi:hypothetical protein